MTIILLDEQKPWCSLGITIFGALQRLVIPTTKTVFYINIILKNNQYVINRNNIVLIVR